MVRHHPRGGRRSGFECCGHQVARQSHQVSVSGSRSVSGRDTVQCGQSLWPCPKCRSLVRSASGCEGMVPDVEYAGKVNDPSADNGFTFRPGEVFMATLAYSQKGLAPCPAKMVDNMVFGPTATCAVRRPYHSIPAITQQHTYNLAGTRIPTPRSFREKQVAEPTSSTPCPKEASSGAIRHKVGLGFAAANNPDTSPIPETEEAF